MSLPALTATLAAVATLATAPADVHAPDDTEVATPRVPVLDWRPCDDGLRCANVRVPLDYDDPDGPTTRLAVAKHPATEALPWYVDSLPPDVLDRFDVVAVDPRGVGDSSPLRCGNLPKPPSWTFPVTGHQVERTLRYDQAIRASCAADAGPILDHMTTADTARDLDLIRRAVGDERLTYYGISYGSYLGATYAAMYPDRIRALVVDGVIDPIRYATGPRPADPAEPVTSRWDSARGGWETLTGAFAECDRVGPRRCATAGESSARWLRVLNRLDRGPVMVGGELLRYQDVVGIAADALPGVGHYRPLMRFVDQTYEAMFGHGDERARAAKTHRRLRDRLQWPRPADDLATQGVLCADSANPTDPRVWVDAGARNDRRAPWLGRLWTWRSSVCARWPGSSADAYRGPFATRTSAPVLLVAHLHDPATPISGARRLNSLLAGSRMLTLDGWGHGALGESGCVAHQVRNYLISGRLPRPGATCRPDELPFPSVAEGRPGA